MSKNIATVERIYKAVFEQRRNVFITAEGGAGKSYLLKQIYNMAREKGMEEDECVLTSTTGVSAYNIGGQTIHSWSGILLPSRITEMDADTLRNAIQSIQNRILRMKKGRSINRAKLILIDEVSMLGGYYLEVMDQILRIVRKNPAPMGGLQIVTTGDLCQLPPVGDVFLFESEVWDQMKNEVFYLNTFYRFTDEKWIKLLSRCRLGELTAEDKTLLRSRLVDRKWKYEGEGVRPTLILPTNKKVEEVNTTELDRLNEEMVYFEATDGIESVVQREVQQDGTNTVKYEPPIQEALTPEELEKINNGFPIDRVLKLKIGCQVMLRKNLNVSTGLVNGTRGVVKRIDSKCQGILVQFENYRQPISTIPWNSASLPITEEQQSIANIRPIDCEWLFPVTFTFQEVKNVEKKESGLLSLESESHEIDRPRSKSLLSKKTKSSHKVEITRTIWSYERSQYPLCLSAAISIHKSQGITLSSIIVDVGSSIFSAGQSYVALSRCKSLEGVYLLNLDVNKIRADSSAKEYDKQLRKRAIFIEKSEAQ